MLERDEAVAGPTGKAESATASCEAGCSGQARDAVAPVDGTDLEGFDAVVLRRVLQVREQRLRLVGGADLEVLADGEVVDRREEDRVAHDAGDRVNDKLVRARAVDDAGAARVSLAVAATMSAAVATTAAASRRGGNRFGGDGFGGHLVGALGGGVVSAAAATGVLGRDLGGGGIVAMAMPVSATVSAASAAALLGGGLSGRRIVAAAAATGVLGGGLSGLGSVAMAMPVSTAATAGVLGGGLSGRGIVATAATAGVLGGGLSGRGIVATAAAATLLGGGLRGSLLGARLLAFATAAATAAAVLGRDGVGVDQLEHLTVSHVFSLSFGPTGHFSEPYPV